MASRCWQAPHPTRSAHQWHNSAVNTTTNRAALSGLAALAAVGISVGLLLASTVPNLVFSDNLIIDTVVRKIGHFVAFGVFAVAGCIGLHHLLPVGRAARLVVLVAIAIALADELTQTRVVGRLASPIDVGIDVAGAVTGAFLYRRRVEG